MGKPKQRQKNLATDTLGPQMGEYIAKRTKWPKKIQVRNNDDLHFL